MYVALLAGAWVRAATRRQASRWRAGIFRAWAAGTARVIRMRIEVRGSAPRPPFFLVSNHLGYVDVILLASLLDCVFIAKSDVAGWPVLGRLCRSVSTLFIDRESKRDIPRVIDSVADTLKAGVGVILFPEATSSDGSGVLPFRPSLLEAAARARLPVSYATLTYRTPEGATPAYLSVCWWGEMTFGPHLLKLLRLPGFHATVVFGAQSFREDDRKILAQKLRHAIEEQFLPVVVRNDE